MAKRATPTRQERPRRGETRRDDPASKQSTPPEVKRKSFLEMTPAEVGQLDVTAMRRVRLASEKLDGIESEMSALKDRKKNARQDLNEAIMGLRFHAAEREKVQLSMFEGMPAQVTKAGSKATTTV